MVYKPHLLIFLSKFRSLRRSRAREKRLRQKIFVYLWSALWVLSPGIDNFSYFYRKLLSTMINWKLMVSELSSNSYTAISKMLLISTMSQSGTFFMQVLIIQNFFKKSWENETAYRKCTLFTLFLHYVFSRLKVIHWAANALL